MISLKDSDISDEELEKELEKAFKKNELKTDVFKILRDEKSAQDLKEKRIKGSKS